MVIMVVVVVVDGLDGLDVQVGRSFEDDVEEDVGDMMDDHC